jgi:hypothetical protein
MKRGLRLAAVVMAVCFVCAAALAQTNSAPKPKKVSVDAGTPVRIDYLRTTKAPPMDFRKEEPPPQQPQPPPAQKP